MPEMDPSGSLLRLIDKIQVAQFEGMIGSARKVNGSATADIRSTAAIHVVEQLTEPLIFSLRNSFTQRLAEYATVADQLQIRAVHHLKDVVRATEMSEERRRLLEKIRQPLHLALQQASRQYGFGGFSTNYEGAGDFFGRRVDGAVAVGPVDFFKLAVAIDGNELILMPASFAAGHDRVDLREDDRPDSGQQSSPF